LQKLGQLALYVCVAAIIYETFDTVVAEIEQAIPWSLVLCVLTIGVSYFLSLAAGLNPQDRVTIALEGSIRNLAVALLIAVSVLERPDIAVLPTVYFLAVLVVAIGFAKTWHLFLEPDQP
jgi:predicted Na+-dependent transporter